MGACAQIDSLSSLFFQLKERVKQTTEYGEQLTSLRKTVDTLESQEAQAFTQRKLVDARLRETVARMQEVMSAVASIDQAAACSDQREGSATERVASPPDMGH